jgi:VRR-NUC domain
MGRPAAQRDLLGRPLRRVPLDRNAEAKRQAAIVEFVRWVAPQIVVWHVPNGGYRTKAEAARLRWVGVLAGVLDLTLALPEGRSAFWETKTPRGRLSDDQKAIIGRLQALGHSWAVVQSIDDARAELARLGIETREAAA